MPMEDQGSLMMSYNMPPAASLGRTEKFTSGIVKQIEKNSNVEDVLTINGFNMLSGTQNTYSAISFIILKDWSLRKSDCGC